MPGPSLDLEMRMRDQKVAFALDALAAKEDKVDQGLGKVSRSAKQAESDLARFAKRTEEIHGEPVQRYAERFKKLEQAFASGKLSLVAYTSAMAQTRKELADAQAQFDGTAAKAKALKDATGKAEQDKAAQAAWYEKVRTRSMKLAYDLEDKELAETAAKSKKADQEKAAIARWYERVRTNSMRLAYQLEEKEARQATKAAREQEKAWREALGPVTQLAAGYVSLSSAVRLVGDAFRYTQKEADDALQSVVSLDDERRKLAQLATNMPAGSLTAMQQRADKAAIASGVDRKKALDIMFQAHSFGFQDQYEQVMGMNPVIDASAAAQLAGKVTSMYGKTLSARQIVNMAIEAGKPSEVDAETIAGALAIATEGGRRIGGTPEESMALVSGLSMYYAGRGEGQGKEGSARVAADRIRAFSHKVATRRPDLADKGILAAFEAIQAMPEDERADFLKENEEVGSLYAALGEALPNVRNIQADIVKAREATGTAADNVTRGTAIRQADPYSRAALLATRTKIERDVSRDKSLAIWQADRTATQQKAEASAYSRGATAEARFGAFAGASIAKFFGGSPETIAAWAARGEALLTPQSPFKRADRDLSLEFFTGQNAETNEILRDIRDQGRGNRTRAVEADALNHPR